MKILVVGGTHGDERTGVDVISLLRSGGTKDVDTLIANPRATREHRRFTQTDLNKSFGVAVPQSYEEMRALEITKRLSGYDLVLEFHNTVSKATCVILTAQEPSLMQLRIAAYFDFERVVITRPGGKSLSSRNPQKTVSFEISTQESRYSADYFVAKISALPDALREGDELNVQIYRRIERRITKSELAALGMTINEFVDFVPFSVRQLELLGLNGELAPFLVGEYGAVNADFAFNIVEIKGRFGDISKGALR